MQGCIFIFNKDFILKLGLLALIFSGSAAMGFAADPGAPPSASKKVEEPATGDDIIQGPFSEYGEFDSSEDEASDEKFFQYGRFFGIGLGVGSTTATGNAGKLYQGGFPTVAFRIDYWFDFQFAFRLAVENSKHNYNQPPDGLSEVNLFRMLFQVKYYFDTRDLSAPITFIGPHLIAGGGLYQRTDNVGAGNGDSTTSNTVATQTIFGFNAGGGFELTLKPKKTYIQLEAMIHMVQWGDQYDTRFAKAGIPDRTGNWITGNIGIMWTW